MTRSAFSGDVDPAYVAELAELRERCATFIERHDAGDFDGCLLDAGLLIAQAANVWKLSPPAGVFDPRTLFDRPAEP